MAHRGTSNLTYTKGREVRTHSDLGHMSTDLAFFFYWAPDVQSCPINRNSEEVLRISKG